MSNDILSEFIRQNYGSIENAQKADREADERDVMEKSGGIYSVLADMAKKTGRTFGDNTIPRDGMTNNPQITIDNSQYASYFKDYDHSRERCKSLEELKDAKDAEDLEMN